VTGSDRAADPLLHPFRLRHLTLRNRVMSTAHAPAYAEGGHPRDRYRLYHEEKAQGGVALTMIGGSTNIAPDSPSVFGQLYAGDDSIVPWFQRLTDGVRNHGAAVMCQITHMGRRTGWDGADWLPVIGPSGVRERAHRAIPKTMDRADIRRVVADFAAAARRCREGGFDGIELLSHSHLLGQFLTPAVNRRCDDYGGSLENRLRLTMQVLDAVRAAVGGDIVVGMRVTGDEKLPDGLTPEEGVEVAQRLEESGHVDFLNILAGAPYDDLGLAGWVAPMGTPSAVDLPVAQRIRRAVSLPIFHAGTINDLATARHAIREGAVDMVGMTRAHIADPHLVAKIERGEEDRIRPCVGLGYCVDRVNQGKDAVCGHNAATGREGRLSHVITPTSTPRRTVIIGGGPAGMEAARVAAERGDTVHLFEAGERLGGQLLMAGKGTTRRQIDSVTAWLAAEVERLGVTLYLSTYAEAEDVTALSPDLVIVATGGWPEPPAIAGAERALSSWDVLSGRAQVSGDILLWDKIGNHPGAVMAEVLAGQGRALAFATPDPRPLTELGPTTHSVAMRALYRAGVGFLPDMDLARIEPAGNRHRVTLRNTLTGEETVLTVDHVVVETGTAPMGDLFDDLRAASFNDGEVDQRAFARDETVFPRVNSSGSFALARIGDAVASRNLHAAIYDAARLVQGLGPLSYQ